MTYLSYVVDIVDELLLSIQLIDWQVVNHKFSFSKLSIFYRSREFWREKNDIRPQLDPFREIAKISLNRSIDKHCYWHLYLLVLSYRMFLMRDVVNISMSPWPSIKLSTLLYDHIYLVSSTCDTISISPISE